MKYLLAVFVTAVVVLSGSYLFFKGPPKFPTYSRNPVSTESGTEVSAPPSFVTVKAGGILVFKAYTVDVPNDWQYKKEAAPTGDIEIDKLILTKDGYTISFYQAATGGAPCLYPGDPDVEGPSSRFTAYTDITTATGDKLRRGSAAGSGNFTVCENQGGGYGQPTSFGHISIEVPVGGATPEIITQIDSILASLRKL